MYSYSSLYIVVSFYGQDSSNRTATYSAVFVTQILRKFLLLEEVYIIPESYAITANNFSIYSDYGAAA